MVRRAHRAFTLTEILIVVTLIAILATIVIGYVQDAVLDTRESVLQENLVRVRAAIERHALHNAGVYPLPKEDGSQEGDEQGGSDDPSEESEATKEEKSPLPTLAGVVVPVCTVGRHRDERTIHIVDDAGTLEVDPAPQTAWKYSTATGHFICNSIEVGTNGARYCDW